jgi:hypothetical protein
MKIRIGHDARGAASILSSSWIGGPRAAPRERCTPDLLALRNVL